MNFTDGTTFLTALIKVEKNKVNQKINFLHDTKQHIHDIVINNDWNTQIVQILREIGDRKFYFQSKFANYTTKTC